MAVPIKFRVNSIRNYLKISSTLYERYFIIMCPSNVWKTSVLNIFFYFRLLKKMFEFSNHSSLNKWCCTLGTVHKRIYHTLMPKLFRGKTSVKNVFTCTQIFYRLARKNIIISHQLWDNCQHKSCDTNEVAWRKTFSLQIPIIINPVRSRLSENKYDREVIQICTSRQPIYKLVFFRL